MNGAEVLLRTLIGNGIDVCFMNPGTSEMQFVAALDRVPGMRGILCLFEGVCSGAADGYARMARKPAATLLHLGPGLANGIANFHNARKARSPVVSIVGEHSTDHLAYDAPLTADISAIARTVSDHVSVPDEAGQIGMATAATVRASLAPPGGVATIIIPANFSWSEAGECGPELPRPVRKRPPSRHLPLGPQTGLLLSGTTLLEKGLRHAGTIAAATGTRIFANRYAARMASGRGRFQPQRIAYFPEPAERQLAGLTTLFLVEAQAPVSFFGYPSRRSTLHPEDCAVQLLADESEDGVAALAALAQGAAPALAQDSRPTLPPDIPLTPDSIGAVVAALLPEGAMISDEMISAGEAVWRHLLNAAPHDHMPVTGGSIGQGLPVALGAAIACPDRKSVALQADGSAMYTFQSLWTIARENLDVTTVIFANRRYRILDIEMQRTGAHGFGKNANDMIDIGRPDLDWVKLSEGMGVEASRATTTTELAGQFGAAMRNRGPRLIEVVL